MFLAWIDLHASKETVGIAGAEVWDPQTGGWSAAGAIDEPRLAPELVVLGDGRVVVAGGYWGATPRTKVLVWSSATRAFEDVGSPEIAIDCQTALRLSGDDVLIASSSEADNWGIGLFHAALYDAKTAKWSRVAMTPDKGVRALAPLDDARVLFVFESHTAVWNRETLEWTPGPGPVDEGSPLACEQSAFAQTLPDGRVLVVSRVHLAGESGWAWIWEPEPNALVPAAALERAIAARDPARDGEQSEIDGLSLRPGGGGVVLGERALYVTTAGLDAVTAVPLPTGQRGAAAAVVGDRVLLAGGERTGSSSAVSAATTIDLTTKGVSATSPLAAARWGASAVTLPDGRVLVVGGSIERWDISWGRFAALFALGLTVLAAVAGLVALGRRSGRAWAVVGVALVVCAIVGGGALLTLLAAIGGAIKG
jgi:hypothetical protein